MTDGGHGLDRHGQRPAQCAARSPRRSIAEDRVRRDRARHGSDTRQAHRRTAAISGRLARAAKRRVKLVYRRDEEFSRGYFRPPA
jgi:hypothetical protein